jgi:hypothetical protein
MECHKIIERIYSHDQIVKLIGKLDPPELREDLRQEFAMALFNSSCDKLKELDQDDRILFFAIRILMQMSMSKESTFYRTYRRRDSDKAWEYIMTNTADKSTNKLAKIAKDHLDTKLLKDAGQAHESILFDKYVELGNIREVAKYFGIPNYYAHRVIKRMKQELKQTIKSKL